MTPRRIRIIRQHKAQPVVAVALPAHFPVDAYREVQRAVRNALPGRATLVHDERITVNGVTS